MPKRNRKPKNPASPRPLIAMDNILRLLRPTPPKQDKNHPDNHEKDHPWQVLLQVARPPFIVPRRAQFIKNERVGLLNRL